MKMKISISIVKHKCDTTQRCLSTKAQRTEKLKRPFSITTLNQIISYIFQFQRLITIISKDETKTRYQRIPFYVTNSTISMSYYSLKLTVFRSLIIFSELKFTNILLQLTLLSVHRFVTAPRSLVLPESLLLSTILSFTLPISPVRRPSPVLPVV